MSTTSPTLSDWVDLEQAGHTEQHGGCACGHVYPDDLQPGAAHGAHLDQLATSEVADSPSATSGCPAWCQRHTPDADHSPTAVIHRRDFPSGVELWQSREQTSPEVILPATDPHLEIDAAYATEVGVDLLQAALLAQGKAVTVSDLMVAVVTGLADQVKNVPLSDNVLVTP